MFKFLVRVSLYYRARDSIDDQLSEAAPPALSHAHRLPL